MNDENKLYWLKVLLAAVAALVSLAFGASLSSGDVVPLGKYGILIAVLIYLTTYPIAIYVLKVDPLKSGGARKILLSGLITYLFVFTVIWALGFTFEYYLHMA